jgi:hypothetical protein
VEEDGGTSSWSGSSRSLSSAGRASIDTLLRDAAPPMAMLRMGDDRV